MSEHLGPAADPRAIGRTEKTFKTNEREFDLALDQWLSTTRGRWVFWEIVHRRDMGNLRGASYAGYGVPGATHETARQEGRRALAASLLQRALSASPRAYERMCAEAAARDADLAERTNNAALKNAEQETDNAAG